MRGQKHLAHGLSSKGVPLEFQEAARRACQVVRHFPPGTLETRARVDAHSGILCSRYRAQPPAAGRMCDHPRSDCSRRHAEYDRTGRVRAIVVAPARLRAIKPSAPSSPIPSTARRWQCRPYSRRRIRTGACGRAVGEMGGQRRAPRPAHGRHMVSVWSDDIAGTIQHLAIHTQGDPALHWGLMPIHQTDGESSANVLNDHHRCANARGVRPRWCAAPGGPPV